MKNQTSVGCKGKRSINDVPSSCRGETSGQEGKTSENLFKRGGKYGISHMGLVAELFNSKHFEILSPRAPSHRGREEKRKRAYLRQGMIR